MMLIITQKREDRNKQDRDPEISTTVESLKLEREDNGEQKKTDKVICMLVFPEEVNCCWWIFSILALKKVLEELR